VAQLKLEREGKTYAVILQERPTSSRSVNYRKESSEANWRKNFQKGRDSLDVWFTEQLKLG